MNQYLDLVKTVLDKGIKRTNRTGVDTIMYFGYHYKVDLQNGFPLLTTKKVFFNSVVHELLWYLKGETHIRNLRNHTKIWDAWTSEDKNWEIGKMYGYQWVNWEKFSKDSKTGEILYSKIPQYKKKADYEYEMRKKINSDRPSLPLTIKKIRVEKIDLLNNE